MQHNDTLEKAKRVEDGETDAFINSEEWHKYNLWCIENLNSMIDKEDVQE